jgi:hypothetical protein
VLNCRDFKRIIVNGKKRLVFPPGCVYIGHRNNRYGSPESKWANPYRKKDGTREERIEKHREP